MTGFRRFVLRVLSVIEVIAVVAATILGGIAGSIFPFFSFFTTGHGSLALFIGPAVGAFVGFLLSATPAGIFFLLDEIAENTRHTTELLLRSDQNGLPRHHHVSNPPTSLSPVPHGPVEVQNVAGPSGRSNNRNDTLPQPTSVSSQTGTCANQTLAAKWDALIKYDPELASADKKLSPLGKKWIYELSRRYLEAPNKENLKQIVQEVIEDGLQEIVSSGRSNLDKWLMLSNYDNQIADAHRQMSSYGAFWEAQLANDYLAIRDKRMLPSIINAVVEQAQKAKKKQDLENKMILLFTVVGFGTLVTAVVLFGFSIK